MLWTWLATSDDIPFLCLALGPATPAESMKDLSILSNATAD